MLEMVSHWDWAIKGDFSSELVTSLDCVAPGGWMTSHEHE